jgi:hypothetical protein
VKQIFVTQDETGIRVDKTYHKRHFRDNVTAKAVVAPGENLPDLGRHNLGSVPFLMAGIPRLVGYMQPVWRFHISDDVRY